MRLRQHGMSLVEIMVAVAIGMIGILIIMQAYITSDRFNRSTLGEGGAQTSGAIALFTMERDIRMAGYGMNNSSLFGCDNIYWYYNGNYSGNAGGTLPNIKLAPVYIDNTAAGPHKITVMYGNTPDVPAPITITSFNSHSSEITVDGWFGFNPNDFVLLVNSGGCTLAQLTKVQKASSKLQVNPGAAGPYNPSGWGSFPTNYSASDSVVNLGQALVRTYSIVNNNLRATDTLLQAAGASPMDLVDGIVDMRAQYGKDNGVDNGTVSNTVYVANDGLIDQYSNVQPANAAEWMQVKSVRIGVLARIGNYEKPEGGVCTATTAVPTWAGSAQPSGAPAPFATPAEGLPSCYRYRVFETVVPMRNMIWGS
jgi:type IV pilus assembly protein PilW